MALFNSGSALVPHSKYTELSSSYIIPSSFVFLSMFAQVGGSWLGVSAHFLNISSSSFN